MKRKHLVTLGLIFAMLATQLSVYAENDAPTSNDQELVEIVDVGNGKEEEEILLEQSSQEEVKENEDVSRDKLEVGAETVELEELEAATDQEAISTDEIILEKTEEKKEKYSPDTPSLQASREAIKITDNILGAMRLKYKDGTGFIAGDLVNMDDDLRFELEWSLPNNHRYLDGDFFEFKLPEQITVHNTLSGALGDYGSYTVDMEGNVKFTFNEKIEAESDIKGTFWFDTELKEEVITTTEETLELVVNGKVVQSVAVNVKPTRGQAISKKGQPLNGDFNTKEVKWTVVVNTTRDSLKNAVIDDPILTGQELILDSMKLTEVEVDLTGKVIKNLDEVTGFTNNSTTENLNIVIGDTNKAYELTFRTKLLEKYFEEGTTKYENTVYLKSDGIKDAQAGGSVSISRPKSIEKTSSKFNKETRSIDWTVNANFTEQDLKVNDVITDEFTFTVGNTDLSDVFEISNITIKQVDTFNENGKPLTTSDAKNMFDITIEGNKVTYKLKEDTNKAFVIKYKTHLKEGAYIHKDGKISNTVGLKGKTSTSSQGVYQQVGKKSNTGINYANKTINWEITINADKQDLKNFVLTDNFSGSGQKLVAESIKISPTSSAITPNTSLEGFEISFGDITESYTITYQTKFVYDFEGAQTPNFKNGVNIRYQTSDGEDYELEFDNEVKPNKETKSNGAKNGQVDNQTKEITWKIDINYNQLNLDEALFKDEIPLNQLYIGGSIKIYETTITKDGGVTKGADVTDKLTVFSSENLVKVDFGTINQSYRVEFKTKDKDGIYNGDEKYTNTAQFVPRVGELHELTANVTLPNQGEFIGKTGSHNKENWTVDWRIDVNKSLSKIKDITVTDELGLGQLLLENTIKVSKLGSADPLDPAQDYTLTVDGNKIKIYFPGPVTDAYVVTYSSYILAEKTMDITNEAKVDSNDVIKGYVEKTEKVNVKISTGGGTGEGTTGGLSLDKFEIINGENSALQGVKFQLIRTVGVQEIIVREGETDANGKLNWFGLQFGTYTLKEILPSGYTGVEEQEIIISSKDPEGIKTLSVENTRETGIVRILKVDSETNEVLKDAQFKIINLSTGQKYTLTTNDKGIILKDISYGEYSIEEIKAPYGYLITKDIPNINIDIGQTTEVTIENIEVRGNVEFVKQDDKNNPLPEAVFGMYAIDDQSFATKIFEAKSDENGLVSFKNIPYGEYIIKEISAPKGYLISEEPFHVSIDDSDHGKTQNLGFKTNVEVLGGVQFTKKGNEADTPYLNGVVFAIYDEKGTEMSQSTSADQGIVKFENLPYGDYTIKELSTVTGFLMSQKEIPVSIRDENHGKIQILDEVENTLVRGSVEFTKKDNEGNTLPGAVFAIYDDNGVELSRSTSGEDGIVSFTNLAYGDYTIKEESAPTGYLISEKPFAVSIKDKDHGLVQKVGTKYNTRVRASIELIKRDNEGNKLSGATFGIYDIEDTKYESPIQTQISDGNGVVRFDGIPYGDYKVKEISAPQGYLLSKEILEVEVRNENHKETLYFLDQINTRVRAGVELLKRDNEGNMLSGATFGIYDLEDTEFEDPIQKQISDGNGLVRFDGIPYGDYKIKEITAPEGYLLSEKILEFEVKDEHHNKTLYFLDQINTRVRASVELIKEDNEGNVLTGTEFGIYDLEDKEFKKPLQVQISDGNGFVRFDDIPYGDYNVKEISTLEGYILSEQVIEVKVRDEDHKSVMKLGIVENTRIRGHVELIKMDDMGNYLRGAEFGIYALEDTDFENSIQTAVSNELGLVRFEEMPFGDYVIKETKAPEGHLSSEEIRTVSITESNHDRTQALKDVINVIIRGSIQLSKSDQYGKALKGAEFAILDSEGKLVMEKVMSDEKGLVVFENIAYGDYTIKETKAPKGYQLDNKEIFVEIREDKVTLTTDAKGAKLLVKNTELGTLEIHKVDSNNPSQGLAGAVFELKDASGKLITKITTDKDGYAYVEDLVYGNYSLVEVKAPQGYVLDKSEHSVQINGDDEGNNIHHKLLIKNKVDSGLDSASRPKDPESDLPSTGMANTASHASFVLVALGIVLRFISKKEEY